MKIVIVLVIIIVVYFVFIRNTEKFILNSTPQPPFDTWTKPNCELEEKCSRDTAKTFTIAVINGGNYKTQTLKKLTDELKPIINHIIKLPEYKEIYDYVVANNKANIEGKTISRILQVIENDI
jgi:hypothetical protein